MSLTQNTAVKLQIVNAKKILKHKTMQKQICEQAMHFKQVITFKIHKAKLGIL